MSTCGNPPRPKGRGGFFVYGKIIRMDNAEQSALNAALDETIRLARELADAENTIMVLLELLRDIVDVHHNGGDIGAVIREVEDHLARLRRTN